ncbi:MAG: TetR/AcrR family transcriptional regulator [Bifidobacteriaceae bacterium]|nr:TetR/AcrR family transcriptional regulator [Bifidobacteriaceae bacterium]
MNSRQSQAKRNRDKLLFAGVEMFIERGYDAVTVDDIAAACGVSKGAFYHHFSSKRNVLATYFEEVIASQAAEAIVPHVGLTDTASLLALYTRAIDGGMAKLGADLMRAFFLGSSTERLANVRDVGGYQAIERIVIAGRQRGEISERHSIAHCVDFILAVMAGIYLRWLWNSDRLSIDDYALPIMATAYEAIAA